MSYLFLKLNYLLLYPDSLSLARYKLQSELFVNLRDIVQISIIYEMYFSQILLKLLSDMAKMTSKCIKWTRSDVIIVLVLTCSHAW